MLFREELLLKDIRKLICVHIANCSKSVSKNKCFLLSVLRDCKNVELSFNDVTSKTDLLRGTKKGSVYLTPYRVN